MQKPDIKFIDKPYRSQLMIHDRYKLMPQGSLAVEIARTLAIAAVPEGESSKGEQLHRLMRPDEIVAKATAIAELVYADIEARGWVLEVPSLTELDTRDAAILAPGFRPVDKSGEGV
jgi:hypothetical protein